MAQVFVIDSAGKLHPLNTQPYDTESVLQRLLADYPELLAGELVDPEAPRRWLLVAREAPLGDGDDVVGRWAVDHLFVDQDAIPTIVEVKRSTDTRIRREVIGQILEYAANGVAYWPVDKLRADFEALCAQQGDDPVRVLADRLGVEAPDEFWATVRTNLRAGKVRLILVADEVPTEVRRIVEFLNGQMNAAEFLAVEIKQFGGGSDLKTLVPRVYGQTEQASGAKGQGARQSRTWTVEQVLEDVDRRFPGPERGIPRAALEWARQHSVEVITGRGVSTGSISFLYPRDRRRGGTPLFTIYSTGHVEVGFVYYQQPPFDSAEAREELARRLNTIAGISLPADAIERRPNIPFAQFSAPGALEQFLAAYEWMIKELSRVAPRP
ncbi:MAG: hypothetical protein AB1635_09075 [Acidobacteriota bacterium]